MVRKQRATQATGYLTPTSSLSSTSTSTRKRSASTDSSNYSNCTNPNVVRIAEEEEIDRIELSPYDYGGITFNLISKSENKTSSTHVNYNENEALCNTKTRNLRPRLIKSATSERNNQILASNISSWPYRGTSKYGSNSGFLGCLPAELTKCLRNEYKIKAVNCSALKRALVSEFKYLPAFESVQASKCTTDRLFSRCMWTSLEAVAEVFTGDEDKDLQNRTEVSFAAWTTVLRLCANGNVRGIDQFRLISIAAVLIQAKLLDEADVSYPKLLKHLTLPESVHVDKLKAAERRVAEQLNWKLLHPSPHVILFLFLDTFSQVFPLAPSFKHLIARVLDILISDLLGFTEMLRSTYGRVSLIVFEVIIQVVSDLYGSLNCCTEEDIVRIMLKSLDEETKYLLFGNSGRDGVDVNKEWVVDVEFKLNVLAAIDKIAVFY